MEGDIEDTVDLNEKYPSVIERYWTKYYFIPKDKRKPGSDGGEGTDRDGKGDTENRIKSEEGNGTGVRKGNQTGGETAVQDRSVGMEEGSESVEGKGTDVRKESALMIGNVEMEESSESMEGKGTRMGKEDTAGSGNVGMEVDSESVEGNVSRIMTGDAVKGGNGGSENVEGNGTSIQKGDRTKGGNTGSESLEGNARMREHREEDMKMEVENNENNKEDLKDRLSSQEKVDIRQGKWTYSSLDTSGHVCVMVHTNKLCLVTLSPKHPALAPGQKITEVNYNVGKFNRLNNQVSGKGKRGAQMMGPQSIVCIITCADGSRHGVLAGVHGKLVEVNERLVSNPQLLSEHTDAEGYIAIILPPIRNGDAPLNRLVSAQEYWAMDQR